jgi:hypothetical protein
MTHHDQPSQTSGDYTPQPLRGELLFTLQLVIRHVNELGTTPYGRRRIVDIAGGSFTGPWLSGEVLPSGADSALVRTDGVFVPDVRTILRTSDGASISLVYTGRWSADPGHLERILQRQGDLNSGNSRLRVFGLFETADPRYLCQGPLSSAQGRS